MPDSVLKALTGGRKMKRNPFDPSSWGGGGGSSKEAAGEQPAKGSSLAEALVSKAFDTNRSTALKRNPFDPTSWSKKGDEVPKPQKNPFDAGTWLKDGGGQDGDRHEASSSSGAGSKSRGGTKGKEKQKRQQIVLKPLRVEPWEPLTTESGLPEPIPKRIVTAADHFDARYKKLTSQVHKIEAAWRMDPSHIAKEGKVMEGIWNVSQSRYFEREKLRAITRIHAGKKREKEGPAWTLEKSIWAPRIKWADSKSFYNTEAIHRRMFYLDWERSLECGLRGYIARHDDGPSELVDEEIEEVSEVLWEHHELIYLIFDYYASHGSSTDVVSMTLNGYIIFIDEFGLSDKKVPSATKTAFDQLFIAVDSSNAGGKIEEKYNRKKALDRQEFLQVIVRGAVMKYVMPGVVNDVSTAVHMLCTKVLVPNADPSIFASSDSTREPMCYNEDVDKVLRKHESSLRVVFKASCKLSGQSTSAGIRSRLISYGDWTEFLRIFQLIAKDLTLDDAKLAFLWARMLCDDEQDDMKRLKWTNLSFEDFLEALCRLSVLKAFPTDEEIAEAGEACAGTYLKALAFNDTNAYEALLEERAPKWGHAPFQPVHRCVDHLISMLIVECQQGQAGDMVLTEREVALFFGAKGGGKS